MAALAALGGVSSAALSIIRAAAHAVVALPGGMQFLAGIHVLWLVLAVGLIRKPGAATITGLLKGAVELFSGNPHGLLVLIISGMAGLSVDVIWLLLRGRKHQIVYMLAGAVGSASNVLVFAFAASLPGSDVVVAGVAGLVCVALVSGAVLAGMLGWWLQGALRRAGVMPPSAAPGNHENGVGRRVGGTSQSEVKPTNQG